MLEKSKHKHEINNNKKKHVPSPRAPTCVQAFLTNSRSRMSKSGARILESRLCPKLKMLCKGSKLLGSGPLLPDCSLKTGRSSQGQRTRVRNRRAAFGCGQMGSTLTGPLQKPFISTDWEKGTPWHFWEDKSRLTSAQKVPLSKNMKSAVTPLVPTPFHLSLSE